jgi:hypothetical protein
MRRGGTAAALAAAAAVIVGAGARGAGAGEAGRYEFGCRSDAGTFVLDTQTGRVWRYDRVDDAWYLYDLEALVGKSGRGRRAEPPADERDDSPPAGR